MKKLNFDVYIGSKMIYEQSEEIKAVVIRKFFLPRGKYNLDGTEVKYSSECFKRLYELGTYFTDWINFCGNEELIHATIYLNIISNKKVFKGQALIDFIDKLNQNPNYEKMRTFTEV